MLWAWPFSWAFPQVSAPAGAILQFQHITTKDGLSDDAITCLFQDKAGYLWIGTEHGLNRYDGQYVKRLSIPPNDLGSDQINSIAQSPCGDLWITTTNAGLIKRDHATGNFIRFRHLDGNPHSLPSDKLNHVLVVNDSLLILSSQDKGAIWARLDTRSYTCHGYVPMKDLDGLPLTDNNWCHRAVRLDERRVWLAMVQGEAPFIADVHTGELLGTTPAAPGHRERRITVGLAINGALYAGGWTRGIDRIDPGSEEPSTFIPFPDEVTAMVPWGLGNFLVGTRFNGLALMSTDQGELQRYRHRRQDPSSLVNDRVRCLLKDRAGNLWVGTANGLSVHTPSLWRALVTPLLTEDDPGDLVFHNLQMDADGTFRISSSRGFYLVPGPGHGAVRHIRTTHNGIALEPTGLFQVKPDVCYIGTETGCFRYDRVQEHIMKKEKAGAFTEVLAHRMFQTRSIFYDSLPQGPRLLVGALGWGVSTFDPSTGVKDESDEPLNRADVSISMLNCSVKDPNGRYWIGSEQGLVAWKPGGRRTEFKLETFSVEAPEPRKLPGNFVNAIMLQGDTPWVALREAGLVRIINGRVQAFSPPPHMPQMILGMALDGQHRVWCTTNEGLLRFSPPTNEWLHVPVNDGTRFRRLTPWIIRSSNGSMAFCSANALIRIDPTDYDHLPQLPEPELIGVHDAWGNPLIPDKKGRIHMGYRASAFKASFTGLRLVGGKRLAFLCRIEGVEKIPRLIRAGDALYYTGLPPGTHRLLVSVRDAFGRSGPERPLLSVTVAPPVWQRWWFHALWAALFSLAVIGWSRYRMNQARKVQDMRDGIARDLHDDIGSTLGSISYYSEALKRQLNPADDAAGAVAEKIGTSSREMIDKMGDIVWSVDPAKDDADSLMERMKGHASDLLASRGITLRFTDDPRLEGIPLSPTKRRALFLIFKEALHNSVKYADCSAVDIALKIGERQLILSVTDDGKGFDPVNVASYNGTGMAGMKARGTRIGARVLIVSQHGKGTSVQVTLPITLSGD